MQRKPLILIIDDVLENIALLGEILANSYEVAFACSGPEGLALVDEAAPDLILLDVMMPEMDGYEVCIRLKSDFKTRDIPVIFVTAKNDADSESAALSAGAIDFIHKPINADVVRARIHLHLTMQQQARQLQQQNALLEQKVADRTQALEDALQRAETARLAKSQFLANMSHELRTPLNAVLGLSHLLQRRLTDPAISTRISQINGAGQKLLKIVNDILDSARLESQQLKIEHIDFSLQLILNDLQAFFATQAAHKNLSFAIDLAPSVPDRLRGDPNRLYQVLANFVDNAIKFSEQGSITLRISRLETLDKGVRLQFEVTDQGIGLDEQQLHQLAAPFNQGDNSSTRLYGGTGLGLSINKQIIELLNGKLGVRSVQEQGSTFWVSLPFQTSPTAAPDCPNLHDALTQARHLESLLAADDIRASRVWHNNEALITPLLGTALPEFQAAIEEYDFPPALTLLRTALAVRGELVEPQSPVSASPSTGSGRTVTETRPTLSNAP